MDDVKELKELKELAGADVSDPHDKGYKKSLSRPGEFLHFLRKYVKADWAQDLEESQLTLCDKEMLERDYEGREADLLYRVNLPDRGEALVFILQELQSTVDYTMIFRILEYVVNTLEKYFLDTDKQKRERAGFRLPAMVPIVFYNGGERWTAVTDMRDYQKGGRAFGDYVLGLRYYLVDLAEVGEEYILSTNTVLDNIMYCDRCRGRRELAEAVRQAYGRVQELGLQEREEFRNWVGRILLSVCRDKTAVAREILSWAGNREDDMAFKYNMVKIIEDERAEGIAQGRAEGRAEAVIELLEDIGVVPEELRGRISAQKDLEILKKWHRLAAHSETVDEFEKQTVSGILKPETV